MKKFNSVFLFWIIIFVFLINTREIYACMCGHTSVSDAYSQAGAVIIGKVEKIEEAETNEEGSQTVTLKIEKSFKAIKQKSLKISQEQTTCDWWFKENDVNKTYLFYLSKYKGKEIYSIITCGRSVEISRANDDLSWLNALPNSLNRTRISGTTKLKAENFPVLANVNLTIIGRNKKYEVTTDRNGLYEIWDVPTGVYSVLPTLPTGLILGWTTSIPNDWTYFWSIDPPNNEALKFTIKSKKCGGVDFMFERKNDEK